MYRLPGRVRPAGSARVIASLQVQSHNSLTRHHRYLVIADSPDVTAYLCPMSGHDGALVVEREWTLADVAAVAEHGRRVELSAAARARIVDGRRVVERLLADGEPVYGLTTGLGALKRVAVGPAEQERFNRLLLRSHRT